ncbi:hypothetical protein ACLB2K_065819 [Fragaria x ananassa]
MKNAMVVGASALRQGLRIGFSDCGFTSNSTLGVTKRALKIEVGLLEELIWSCWANQWLSLMMEMQAWWPSGLAVAGNEGRQRYLHYRMHC